MSTPPRLLTLTEVADALRLSPHIIRKWVQTGKVHPVRICRRLLFDPADLEHLVNEHREENRHDIHQSLRMVRRENYSLRASNGAHLSPIQAIHLYCRD